MKVGVVVGVSVIVGVGVNVGPNNCPGPQAEAAKLMVKTRIAVILFIGLSCVMMHPHDKHMDE